MDLSFITDLIPASWQPVWVAVTTLISACAGLVAVLPLPKDPNSWYAKVHGVLNKLAINILNARNAKKVDSNLS